MSMELKNYRVRFCKMGCYLAPKKNFFISYPKSGRTWVRFLVDAYKAELYGLKITNHEYAWRTLK